MGIKIIATDFDLTLHEWGKISHSAQKTILKAMSNGTKIGIVSGQNWYNIYEVLAKNGFRCGQPFPSFVICRERYIYNPDGKIMPEANGWNMKKQIETEQLISNILPKIDTWIRRLKSKKLTPHVWALHGEYGLDIQYQKPGIAKKAEKLINKWTQNIPLTHVQRNYALVQVTLANAGKGATLNYLANLLKISPENILAIGDSMNDLDMLDGRYGFFPAAVGNADPELKKIVLKEGGYVANHGYGDGIAEILERCVLQT